MQRYRPIDIHVMVMWLEEIIGFVVSITDWYILSDISLPVTEIMKETRNH